MKRARSLAAATLVWMLLAAWAEEAAARLSLFPARDPDEILADLDSRDPGPPLLELKRWRPYGLAEVAVNSARVRRKFGPLAMAAGAELQDWGVLGARRLSLSALWAPDASLRLGLAGEERSLDGGDPQRELTLLLSGGESLVLSLRWLLWETADPSLRVDGRGLAGLAYEDGHWRLRLFRAIGAELSPSGGIALNWRRGGFDLTLLAGAGGGSWQGLSLGLRQGRWGLRLGSRLHEGLGPSHGASFLVH